jgi:hypothetical protein
MLNKFPNRKEQLKRAKLISPFFKYLKGNKSFLKDVEDLRIKYGIRKTVEMTYKIPTTLLNQEFWDPDYDTMSIVLSFWPELRPLWEQFHSEIEELATKYRLKNFPNLIKEYVLKNTFGELLTRYKLSCGADWCDIWISRWITKKDFDEIWNKVQEYNKENPESVMNYRRFSDEVLEKYSSVEKINRKYFTDQVDIILLINKELSGSSSQAIERKIAGWDKSKKSRLNKIVKELFSLIDDLNDAEI